MISKCAVLILANINPKEIGLRDHTEIKTNEFISRAIKYSKGASSVVVGINNSLNNSKTEAIDMGDLKVKFLPKTKGALASLGLLLDQIPDELPVVVVPTNAWIEESLHEFLDEMISQDADAGIAVIKSNSPDLSYVRYVDSKIVEIHEKEVVGDFAITGHFFFRNKRVVLDCINWALLNNINKNGLLYIAPSLNYSITKGMKVCSFTADFENYVHINYSKGK